MNDTTSERTRRTVNCIHVDERWGGERWQGWQGCERVLGVCETGCVGDVREGVGDVREGVGDERGCGGCETGYVGDVREGDKLNRGVSNGTTAIPLPWTTILKH